MARLQKSTALYKHPFCKGFWRDAAAELKDTKMLVFAALIVALRVTLKTVVRIPLAPNLDITPAFLANALGAMVYGPVVGAIGAFVSDFLGVMLRGDEYFLPYVLTEIAGTMIFAMFFYRQKVNTLRVVLSRFCICLGVNILLQTPIDVLYNIMKGSDAGVAKLLTLPRIFKNLFMFPIEAVVLTVFLSAIQPFTYRMKLTYNPDVKLHFGKKQIALLVCLLVVGIGSVFGYLFVHYDNTSLTTGYSAQEVVDQNKRLHEIVTARTGSIDETNTVAVIEYAQQPFLEDQITYTVAIYEAKEGKQITDDMWSLKKTPASKHEDLSRLATATVVTDKKTDKVLSYEIIFVR